MQLKIVVPTEVLIDTEVIKVIAETENGALCVLPQHSDFVTILVPGPLAFITPAGDEVCLAVDEGTLVKCGTEILVSAHQAIRWSNVGHLR